MCVIEYISHNGDPTLFLSLPFLSFLSVSYSIRREMRRRDSLRLFIIVNLYLCVTKDEEDGKSIKIKRKSNNLIACVLNCRQFRSKFMITHQKHYYQNTCDT